MCRVLCRQTSTCRMIYTSPDIVVVRLATTRRAIGSRGSVPFLYIWTCRVLYVGV